MKRLSDEDIAQLLHNVQGTKLKFESKLTDQDVTAFKDELRIVVHAIVQEAHNNALRQVRVRASGTSRRNDDQGNIWVRFPEDFWQELTKEVEAQDGNQGRGKGRRGKGTT